MKNLKYILILFFLFGNLYLSNSQEANKTMFSFSFGIGYYGYFSNYSDYGFVSFVDEQLKKPNINLVGDIAFEMDTYIFSFQIALSLVEPTPYEQSSHSEYNLTVGKEFLYRKGFSLEGHIGAGYLTVRERYAPNGPIDLYGTIGFPLRIKANFYMTKNFALGLNPNANFNFDRSIMSINLMGKLRL